MERLHKFLARAGVDSRRACEELMLAGRVSVNGRVQRELGTQIDPDVDDIRVDGEPIKALTEMHYVMLHKPRGVITSMNDPEGRPTVAELVQTSSRLFPVGRLDFDSEGLLLMTDDGDLAYKLTHPSFEVEKEYHALLNMAPNLEQLRQWREGVDLDGGSTAPAWVEALDETPDGVWVRVVIHEGRNRQVRRVAEQLGLEVKRLIRLREGPLTLGDLPLGKWRALTPTEITNLRLHAKRSRAWLPTRPLPESPQDENPQERPRFQRIDRSGQPQRTREDFSSPRESSEGGNRPLRRRGEPTLLTSEATESGDQTVPAQVEQPLRRRDQPTTQEAGIRERQPRHTNDRPRRDDERGNFNRPRRDDARSFERPRRDDDRPAPHRDDARSFDRPRDDNRGDPRRDDERGSFDRPRRDDGRPAPRRDEGRNFDRPRRDDGRPAPRRDDERGSFDRPRRDDDRPAQRRPKQQDERPVRQRIEPAHGGVKTRPWEQSQAASQVERETPASAEVPQHSEPASEPTPAPRPQLSANQDRTTKTEPSTPTRRPWTRMGGRGITGRSRTSSSLRKTKGDDNE